MGMTKKELIKELKKKIGWYGDLIKGARRSLKQNIDEGYLLHSIVGTIKTIQFMEIKKEAYEEILDMLEGKL